MTRIIMMTIMVVLVATELSMSLKNFIRFTDYLY